MSKRDIDIHLRRYRAQCQKFDEQIGSLEQLVDGRVAQLRKTQATLEELADQLAASTTSYKEAIEREIKAPLRELQRENAKLKAQLEASAGTRGSLATDIEEIKKAQTIAVFDSILFAIENWSDDGQMAPDLTLVSQSALFPIVYERVMKGDDDYLLTKVPHVAYEVVKRGREFVRAMRMNVTASLLERGVWESQAAIVQKWWVNDALPLIYGARSPDWDKDEPFSLTSMLAWRDEPASRALDFPLLFDGMELVKKHGDAIRESTGLPEFNKTIMTTRIQP